ncbi:hypothetical protein D6C98_07805 [Aureobasidium pullulans]|nr:hypothetical protein D6C98_07805 [Aureobasidium pullulans]
MNLCQNNYEDATYLTLAKLCVSSSCKYLFVRRPLIITCPADCGPWSHDACTHRNFERFLDFINRRIDLGSYTRGVGFWFYCYVPWEWPNVPYRTLRVRARCQRLVPRTVDQLWEWHEEFRIASKDFPEAYYFEFDDVNIKISVIDFEASIASLKKAIVHIQSQIDQQHVLRLNNVPCWPHSPITKPSSPPTKPDLCPTFLLEFHTSTINQVIGLWRAKEEQYSVHHLFDIAESWLSKDQVIEAGDGCSTEGSRVFLTLGRHGYHDQQEI